MLFGRSKSEPLQKTLEDIFDSQDNEIIVVRGGDCSILMGNEAARRRIESMEDTTLSCKKSFCRSFNYLCEKCPHGTQGFDVPVTFDAEDNGGRSYSVRGANITWSDGRPATMLVFRDTSQEKADSLRLHSLAYIDQLTSVPNRLSFREAFEASSADIADGGAAGVVAIFDLDNFKAVNDTYGHNTGDIMLRRLAEHFQSDRDFSGHIYRLGGDEFVLFFCDNVSRFASDAELAQHYQALLSGALNSYTIPNIDIACTLSMGVAVFPKNGSGASELLRKADIALYEAKAAGRNCMVLFEEKYEKAKKFKDIYINIQPILLPTGKTMGYELNDQGGEGDDPSAVNLTEFNRTMDALGIGDIDSGVRYFITYSSQLLSPAVVANLPRDSFVVQVPMPATQKDVDTVKRLKAAGYKLCVTGLRAASTPSTLSAFANFARFDPGDSHASMQKNVIRANPRVTFIASGTDSQRAFDNAKEQGFKLFQGFFFSNAQPSVKKTKEIDPIKFNYMRLLQLTSAGGHVDFREISSIISSDVALSYKLLRLLNSAAVGLRNVSSISMAVTYLGEENLKKWIGLLALRGIADDKPLELVRMSLIRAQFGELLAPHFRLRRDPKQVFLLGMLSLLHVALEKSREELLEDIPVAEEISESLLTHSGIYSDMLPFYENYEYGNWDEISRFSADHNISCQLINDCYVAAVKWYNDLTK